MLGILIVAVVAACARSQSSVATLVEKDGTVESQLSSPQAAWTAASPGQRYRIGDAIRTGPESGARLRIARNGTLDLDPESIVRFQRSAGQAIDLGVEAGAVEIEAADAELVLETEAGAARISGRGRARVTAKNGETRLEVLAGTIVIEAENGSRTYTAGARIEIDMGGVIVEDEGPRDAGPPPPPPIDAAEAIAIDEPTGPAKVDLVIDAGESAVLHDPQPPTAIGMRIKCPALGHLDISSRGDWKSATTTAGHHGISGEFPTGTHRYRIRCGDEVEASGKIVVRRDAAAKELPARPPRNMLDADGRPYTVLYQNRLPELVLRWPDAPAAAGYVLHVVTGAKERTFPVKSARYTFGSGDLGEGTHRWWFEAGSERSPETTVQIDFDNAAATVYIRRVDVGADTVRVEGAAVPDARVSLEDDPVALDDQRRFSASGPITAGRRTLALRIATPSSGVHYYVLRAANP
jgi:hypothetical protein